METANDTVKFVRLVTGEDIISEIMEVDDTTGKHVILYNPLKIMYLASPVSSDKVSISLLEWVFSRISDKQEFKLESRDVLTIAPPTQSLNEYYWDTIEYFARKKAARNIDRSMLDDDLEEKLEQILKGNLGQSDIDDDSIYYDSLDETPIEETEGYRMLKEFLSKKRGSLH